jgi:hypothetical protein
MSLRVRRLAFVAAAFMVALVAKGTRGEPAGQSTSTGGCALSQASALETSSSASCSSCHGASHGGRSHPVDFEYDFVQGAHAGLRPLAEVVKRGVFLPNGKVECVTYHSARSPWKDHIALPPGSRPTPAVDPHTPATYEDGPVRDQLIQAVRSGQLGAAVTAKPLCLACHALD